MILLDTNVPSETTKSRRDPAVIQWLADHGDDAWLPTIVLAELRYGVEKLAPSHQRSDLENWLTALTKRFEERMLSFDTRAAEAHGRLRARLKLIGKPMDAPDSYIAAIALSRGAQIATRNVKHFEHAGVALIDPWQA